MQKKDTMKHQEYTAFITLTKFIDAEIIEHEDRCGICKKGVFIPIEQNDLFKTNSGHYMTTLNVNLLPERTQKGYTHYAKQYLTKNTESKLKDLGFSLNVIGHLRPKNRNF